MHMFLPAVALAGGLLVAGCASQQSPTTALDAVALSHPPEPVALLAPRPGLSVVGKDYLYAAPVTVNRQGGLKEYLWFALGSTTDRVLTNTPEPRLETIVLVVDGMPMTFDLVPWTEASGETPFDLGVLGRGAYGARVTRSQVRRIASATSLAAYVTDADNRSPTYVLAGGDLDGWQSY